MWIQKSYQHRRTGPTTQPRQQKPNTPSVYAHTLTQLTGHTTGVRCRMHVDLDRHRTAWSLLGQNKKKQGLSFTGQTAEFLHGMKDLQEHGTEHRERKLAGQREGEAAQMMHDLSTHTSLGP